MKDKVPLRDLFQHVKMLTSKTKQFGKVATKKCGQVMQNIDPVTQSSKKT